MLFTQNKLVVSALIFSSLLFIFVFALEKTKVLMNIVPKARGEVSIGEGLVITSTKTGHPIIVKKDDMFFGNEMRFSGSLKNIFSDVALSLCKPNDTIVNIGAYFGYDAICMGSKLKGTGKIYAFEDNRSIYSCLRKSIVLNDMDQHVIVKNLALSDKKGICEKDDFMAVKENPDGSFSTPPSFVAQCNTLDNELKEVTSKVNLMLIDDPGYEFDILRGAQTIIRNSPKLIILSYYERKFSARNVPVKQELDKFVDDGYYIYFVDEDGRTSEPNTSEIVTQDSGVIIITKNRMVKESINMLNRTLAKQNQETQEEAA